MHFQFCFVFLLTLVHTAPGEPTPKLKLMGTIGPHSYFYDTGRRIWNESLAYCESFGMELADLPTMQHIQLVRDYAESDPEFTLDHGYWTSGRNSFEISQFAWQNTNGQVAADLPFDGVYDGPHICLNFNHRKLLEGVRCDAFLLNVLCQS